jgi:hypothetical protein
LSTYRTTRPGTLCNATSDAAVNCHALSPVSSHGVVKFDMVSCGYERLKSVVMRPIAL